MNPIILFCKLKYPGILQQPSITFRFPGKLGQAGVRRVWAQKVKAETCFCNNKVCVTFSQSLMSQRLSLLVCKSSRTILVSQTGQVQEIAGGGGWGLKGGAGGSEVAPLCFSPSGPAAFHCGLKQVV